MQWTLVCVFVFNAWDDLSILPSAQFCEKVTYGKVCFIFSSTLKPMCIISILKISACSLIFEIQNSKCKKIKECACEKNRIKN
jgi:hypothetical protein